MAKSDMIGYFKELATHHYMHQKGSIFYLKWSHVKDVTAIAMATMAVANMTGSKATDIEATGSSSTPDATPSSKVAVLAITPPKSNIATGRRGGGGGWLFTYLDKVGFE